MTDLLPCPFCGRDAVLDPINEADGACYVYCSGHEKGCVCDLGSFDSASDAITAWNTRHPSRNDVLEEAARERDELQELFDLQYKADMRAVKRWQAANPGNDLTWPDRADFGFWLMNKVEEMLAALEPFADQADDIERFIEDAAKNGTSPIMATKKFRLADFKKAQSIVRALKDRDG